MKESLQRQAASKLRQKIISSGIIDEIGLSGQSSAWQVHGILIGNGNPGRVDNFIRETSIYYSTEPYNFHTSIEDGGYRRTEYQSQSRTSRTKAVRRAELEAKISILPEKAASRWCSHLGDRVSELQSELVELGYRYTELIELNKLNELEDIRYELNEIIEKIKKIEIELDMVKEYIPKTGKYYDKWEEKCIIYIQRFENIDFNPPSQSVNIDDYISLETDQNITKLELNSLLVFLDEEGNSIKMNDKKVGIQINWNELLGNCRNPLYKYLRSEISLYLLLNPFESEFSTSNTVIDWDSIENDDGAIERNTLAELREINDIWKLDNIKIKTSVFSKSNSKIRYHQQEAWYSYLKAKGYSDKITQWVLHGNHNFEAMNDKNSPITIEAINTIAHEYNVILRELEKWIVQELMIQQKYQINSETSLFSKWEQEDLDLGTIWENMKFKKNGNIKAWYDGCELTYDGLEKKQRVHLAFIDFATYEYTNGTEDWSYMSEMWTIGGYSSGLEQYMGELAVQGLRWMTQPEAAPKRIAKLAKWLIKNVFAITGIV